VFDYYLSGDPADSRGSACPAALRTDQQQLPAQFPVGRKCATRRPRSPPPSYFSGNAGAVISGTGADVAIMWLQQDKFETHHLTCPVCGALPGTTCIDNDYRELTEVHPSRRMSVGERNWRFRQGWEPPELVEQRNKQRATEAPLFNPRHGSEAKPVRKALRRTGLAASKESWLQHREFPAGQE